MFLLASLILGLNQVLSRLYLVLWTARRREFNQKSLRMFGSVIMLSVVCSDFYFSFSFYSLLQFGVLLLILFSFQQTVKPKRTAEDQRDWQEL